MFTEDLFPIVDYVSKSVEDDAFALCLVRTSQGRAYVYFPIPPELTFDETTISYLCDEFKAGLLARK